MLRFGIRFDGVALDRPNSDRDGETVAQIDSTRLYYDSTSRNFDIDFHALLVQSRYTCPCLVGQSTVASAGMQPGDLEGIVHATILAFESQQTRKTHIYTSDKRSSFDTLHRTSSTYLAKQSPPQSTLSSPSNKLEILVRPALSASKELARFQIQNFYFGRYCDGLRAS